MTKPFREKILKNLSTSISWDKVHELTAFELSTDSQDWHKKNTPACGHGEDKEHVKQFKPSWQKWARAGVGVLKRSSGTFPRLAVAAGGALILPQLTFVDEGLCAITFHTSTVDLDSDNIADVRIEFWRSRWRTPYGSESSTNCNVDAPWAVKAYVGARAFSSVPFGLNVPDKKWANFDDRDPYPRYVRLKTSNRRYGWLSVGSCRAGTFNFTYYLEPRLLPDGSLHLNNPPTVTGVPNSITVTEDVASDVNLANVTFADLENDSLTVTLTASSGKFTASSGGGVTVGGSGTGTLSLSGTVDNINVYLDTTSNIKYTGATNLFGNSAATVTISANDGLAYLSSNPVVNVDILAVNDAPTAGGLPADITVVEDIPFNFGLSAVTFVDIENDSLTVTLAANSGWFSASSIGGVTVNGSGTGILTLSGTVTDINTYLDTATNIKYTGASNINGDNAATVTVNADDGTVNPQLGVINIDIVAVNDAPTATGIPTDVTVVEETLSNFDLSAITFADIDGDSLTVILTASSGTFSASSGGGVTVGGSGTGMLTLAGTVDNINTYLDTASNIKYTGASNINGNNAASVNVNANDGTVNPLLGVINVDITAMNHAPIFTGTPTIIGNARVGHTLGLMDVGTHDIDGDTVSMAYQWKADSVNIGSDSPAYTLTNAERGKTVTCTVTANDGMGGVTVFSTNSVLVNDFPWSLFVPAFTSPNRVDK